MNRLAAFGRSHRDVVASLALLALPFVVLAHAFVPGKVMSPADNVFVLMPWTGANPGVSPKNPRLSEVTLLFHPAAIHAADEIRSGHFPLWNPHTFGARRSSRIRKRPCSFPSPRCSTSCRTRWRSR